jgi:hypothetical protein
MKDSRDERAKVLISQQHHKSRLALALLPFKWFNDPIVGSRNTVTSIPTEGYVTCIKDFCAPAVEYGELPSSGEFFERKETVVFTIAIGSEDIWQR